MAEAAPFLGVISFGLTICKDLYTYYHAFKGFDSSIGNAYDSITEVAKTLVLLKDSCDDPSLDRERKERVAACVHSCEDALNKLNERLQQLKVADPEGFREKSVAKFKRHAFPFKKESLEGLRNSAVEVQRRLALAIQILDLAERLRSQRVLDHLHGWSSEATVTLRQISDDTQQLLSAAISDEVMKILRWLSPTDPWTNHHSARGLHQAGTGQWVLDNDVYKSWLNGSFRHLWIYGKAGCGKTVLFSTIAEHVQHHCHQAVDFGFALFYFTFSDRGKQSYEALLRSLVAQLGTRGPGKAVLRERCNQLHELQGGLSRKNLETILLAVLASYDTVFVALDALDECPEEANARSMLFNGLHHMAKSASNLRLLMTSRDLRDIRVSIESLSADQLPIVTRAVHEDIESYVSHQLSHGQYFKRLKQESLDLVRRTITEKADGMFRWAFCQLHELSQSKSTRPSRVREGLNALPATLDDTYARMLERIGPADRQDALTLIRWLAYAIEPPTLSQLQTAVIVRPEDDKVDFGDEGELGDSLSILSGLVVISDDVTPGDTSAEQSEDEVCDRLPTKAEYLEPGTRIRLAHFSVKEYFESTRILGSEASFFGLEAGVGHRFLLQSCLTYLIHYSKSSNELTRARDLTELTLLKYAASRWGQHSRLQSGDDVSREVALLTSKVTKNAWLEIRNIFHTDLLTTASSVYCAASLKLHKVAAALLNAGEDPNATDGTGFSPLLVAITKNDEAMVKLLLSHKADINEIVGKESSLTSQHCALAEAAKSDSPLTRLLIDHGADVNIICDRKTALSAASARGHKWAVELLLERGAHTNGPEDREIYTALTLASSQGFKEIVELLIAKGANVNGRDVWGTPLLAAVIFGHEDIATLLIDAGADVNASDSEVLFHALRLGQESVVDLLEAKGANEVTPEQLNAATESVLLSVNYALARSRQRRGERSNWEKQDWEAKMRRVRMLMTRGADLIHSQSDYDCASETSASSDIEEESHTS